MRLYHWTTSDRAADIRREGIRETNYDWPGPGQRGVWSHDDPAKWKGIAGTSCLAFDIPDELFETLFHDDRGWLIPGDLANRFLAPEP